MRCSDPLASVRQKCTEGNGWGLARSPFLVGLAVALMVSPPLVQQALSACSTCEEAQEAFNAAIESCVANYSSAATGCQGTQSSAYHSAGRCCDPRSTRATPVPVMRSRHATLLTPPT